MLRDHSPFDRKRQRVCTLTFMMSLTRGVTFFGVRTAETASSVVSLKDSSVLACASASVSGAVVTD
jgi:hypothetical protein